MKFSVCMDAVYAGRDIIAALHEIADLGFKYYELWNPAEKDMDAIRRVAQERGLQNVVGLWVPPVTLVDPAKNDDFIAEFRQNSALFEETTGCKTFLILAGLSTHTDESHEQQLKNVANGLKKLVPYLDEKGYNLILEPLSGRNDPSHADYLIKLSDEAFDICDQIGSPRITVLFDIYHQTRSEGDVTVRIRENVDKIGHIHCAGNPGRAELDIGEINYDYILEEIGKTGYDRFVGLEYWPTREAKEGLAKLISKYPQTAEC